MNQEDIVKWTPFLKRVPLFAALADETIRKIASRLQILSLPKGSTLYAQGDAPDALYVVLSGQVRIVQKVKDQETTVAFIGRGGMIGEGGVLTGEPRSMTIKLTTTCEFLKLPLMDFEAVISDAPSILLHLSKILSHRLIAANRASAAVEKTLHGAQLIALSASLADADQKVFAVHLALELLEQTRRRVLLVDMSRNPGALAKTLALPPVPVSEEVLRQVNLSDPGLIRTLSQQHASGLEIMTLPWRTLGAGLYGGAYFFLNFLRDVYDFILVVVDEDSGPVGKSVLSESDWIVLAGASAGRPAFSRALKEATPLADPSRLLIAWLGAIGAEDRAALADRPIQGAKDSSCLAIQKASPLLKIAWSESVSSLFEKTGSPYEALESCPKARDGLGRLARHLGGVKVGVAFGSGAALGYSLIGVLKAFKKESVPVDILTGTSMGALIAGLAAAGLEPEQIEDIALRVDKRWVYKNLFLDLVPPRSGFFGGRTMLKFFREHFGDKDFLDLDIPFACSAADIETGAEIVLSQGPVAEAVRASCGLPLIFSPYRLGDLYLVDGGLVNPVPTSILADMGADLLIAVNLTEPPTPQSKRRPARPETVEQLVRTPINWENVKEIALPPELKAPSLLSVFFRMIYTMEYEIARTKMTPAHVNIQPELRDFSWTDLHRAKEIIQAGERLAGPYISQIKAQIPFFSDRCKIPLRLSSPLR